MSFMESPLERCDLFEVASVWTTYVREEQLETSRRCDTLLSLRKVSKLHRSLQFAQTDASCALAPYTLKSARVRPTQGMNDGRAKVLRKPNERSPSLTPYRDLLSAAVFPPLSVRPR
jgi:hypothetical protein